MVETSDFLLVLLAFKQLPARRIIDLERNDEIESIDRTARRPPLDYLCNPRSAVMRSCILLNPSGPAFGVANSYPFQYVRAPCTW